MFQLTYNNLNMLYFKRLYAPVVKQNVFYYLPPVFLLFIAKFIYCTPIICHKDLKKSFLARDSGGKTLELTLP